MARARSRSGSLSSEEASLEDSDEESGNWLSDDGGIDAIKALTEILKIEDERSAQPQSYILNSIDEFDPESPDLRGTLPGRIGQIEAVPIVGRPTTIEGKRALISEKKRQALTARQPLPLGPAQIRPPLDYIPRFQQINLHELRKKGELYKQVVDFVYLALVFVGFATRSGTLIDGGRRTLLVKRAITTELNGRGGMHNNLARIERIAKYYVRNCVTEAGLKLIYGTRVLKEFTRGLAYEMMEIGRFTVDCSDTGVYQAIADTPSTGVMDDILRHYEGEAYGVLPQTLAKRSRDGTAYAQYFAQSVRIAYPPIDSSFSADPTRTSGLSTRICHHLCPICRQRESTKRLYRIAFTDDLDANTILFNSSVVFCILCCNRVDHSSDPDVGHMNLELLTSLEECLVYLAAGCRFHAETNADLQRVLDLTGRSLLIIEAGDTSLNSIPPWCSMPSFLPNPEGLLGWVDGLIFGTDKYGIKTLAIHPAPKVHSPPSLSSDPPFVDSRLLQPVLPLNLDDERLYLASVWEYRVHYSVSGSGERISCIKQHEPAVRLHLANMAEGEQKEAAVYFEAQRRDVAVGCKGSVFGDLIRQGVQSIHEKEFVGNTQDFTPVTLTLRNQSSSGRVQLFSLKIGSAVFPLNLDMQLHNPRAVVNTWNEPFSPLSLQNELASSPQGTARFFYADSIPEATQRVLPRFQPLLPSRDLLRLTRPVDHTDLLDNDTDLRIEELITTDFIFPAIGLIFVPETYPAAAFWITFDGFNGGVHRGWMAGDGRERDDLVESVKNYIVRLEKWIRSCQIIEGMVYDAVTRLDGLAELLKKM